MKGFESRLPMVAAIVVLLLVPLAPAAAFALDLNGLCVGKWTDKGRNRSNNRFSIRISHEGDRIEGRTLDKTVRVKGRLVEDRVDLEWDRGSGNYGAGHWQVLDGGNRLRGEWDSEGSGRFFREWDLVRG